MPIDGTDAEVLVETEILDLNLVDEIPCQGALTSVIHEEPSTSSADFHEVDQQGIVQISFNLKIQAIFSLIIA